MGAPTKRQRINKKIGQGVSKMTPEAIKKLEQAFSFDCSIDEACLFADITPPTYYKWLKKNPKLVKRFEALRNKPVLLARERVVKGLSESYSNAMDYLSRKRKGEFSTKEGSAPPPAEGMSIFNGDQITNIAKRALERRGATAGSAGGKK